MIRNRNGTHSTRAGSTKSRTASRTIRLSQGGLGDEKMRGLVGGPTRPGLTLLRSPGSSSPVQWARNRAARPAWPSAAARRSTMNLRYAFERLQDYSDLMPAIRLIRR